MKRPEGAKRRLRDGRASEDGCQLRVNWGRGRLRKHQSFHSFAAMFCALNKVSPRQFREYWNGTFPEPTSSQTISGIAELLDEQPAIVETVFGRDRWSIAEPRYSHIQLPELDTLSYCPLCISDGFHGNFHEAEWLRRCPIHGTKLTRTFLHLSNGSSVFDRYVLQLTKIFEENDVDWTAMSASQGKGADPAGGDLLGELLGWRDGVRDAMTGWLKVCCSHTDDTTGYQFSHLDIWLGRLAWFLPMSEELSDLFLVKPWTVVPVVHQCHGDLARELGNIVDTVNFGLFLWTYRTARLLENIGPPDQDFVADAIAAFSLCPGNRRCKCIWGINNQQQWLRYKPGVIHGYSSAVCPSRYAASELRREWGQAFPEKPKEYIKFEEKYHICVDRLVKCGLAEVTGLVPHEWLKIPSLHFFCSEEATLLFEIILSSLARAHLDELTHWLGTIRAGKSPESRDYFPSSVFLVQNDRTIDAILVWPAGAGRPLKNVVDKSWLSCFKVNKTASRRRGGEKEGRTAG